MYNDTLNFLKHTFKLMRLWPLTGNCDERCRSHNQGDDCADPTTAITCTITSITITTTVIATA